MLTVLDKIKEILNANRHKDIDAIAKVLYDELF